MSDLPPEEAAQFAPGGPIAAAYQWFAAIVDRSNLAEAWTLTAHPLRVALVQGWMINTGRDRDTDRDTVALALAEGPGHLHWADFASHRIQRWLTITFATFNAGTWGTVTPTELVTPDVEFVRFASDGTGRKVDEGEPFWAQTLTMQLVDDAWLVAGIGRTIARPGWPPSEETLPTDHGPR